MAAINWIKRSIFEPPAREISISTNFMITRKTPVLTQLLAVAITAVGFVACQSNTTTSEMKTDTPTAPVAQKKPHELSIHGDVRNDEYYWLNERENQEVLDYLTAENDYTASVLKHTEQLQESLFNEIVGRIKQTDESVPYMKNGYYYYTRFEEGDEYPIYCRREGSMEADEQVMLDVNELAKGHEYYSVSGVSVSPDNNMLAFGVDKVSRRIYTIHFKNLTTGEILSETIGNNTGSAHWANDNKTVFYTQKDESLRAYKIFRYELGGSGSDLVFHEDDETFTCFVYRTKSGKYLSIGSHSTLSAEAMLLDADNPTGEFQSVLPREENHEYDIYQHADYVYIRSNWEAKNFRLMRVPVSAIGTKDQWEEVIAHRDDVLLEDVDLFDNYMVVDERKGGLTQLRIMDLVKNEEHYLDFGEPTYSAGLGINLQFESNVLRYGYTSLTTPSSTFDYNMDTREKTLLKQQEVVGDFDSGNYTAERINVTARDGKVVPMSMVYRKGMERNGKNPLLLYSYGSYGSSSEAYFSSVRLSLLDRGFVFAVAHIRGGMEMGRDWYEDGKLLNKKNTFTDFIDCADYLVAEKYTDSDHLFAMGGSAGGLLMGAVVNMRPELWKGVVAAVPFVDVVTTMLDETIPLTTGEWDEWGNPQDEEYYHYMKSYSPYDNVVATDYPNLLVTTGLHDSQVQYWEPAKWVARMRDRKTDNNQLLLLTNMEAGHGGASGRFKRYRETALEYAFMLDLVGIDS